MTHVLHGRLTGQVAHDFNNLLMVFQAGVNGVERKHDDPEKRSRFLSMMKEGITRGAELTQRLRSYSTKSKGERERIDLRDFVNASKPLLENTLGDGVALLVDPGAESSCIVVDAKDLQTALVNLCSNARDAIPDGGTVTLTVRNHCASGRPRSLDQLGHVEIEVADTGAGFNKEAARRAFEPFFTTKSGASVGLGLTQVYGFAERSGGCVRIEPASGEGAAVVISLPRTGTSSEDVQTTRKGVLPKQVLVVDDKFPSLGWS